MFHPFFSGRARNSVQTIIKKRPTFSDEKNARKKVFAADITWTKPSEVPEPENPTPTLENLLDSGHYQVVFLANL